MIDLYSYDTSNGMRARILLEECELPYQLHAVDLLKGEHRKPEFLALNPAGAIPVLVDDDGPDGVPLTLTQSSAILLYLAEKTGRFLPTSARERVLCYQWLFFAATDCATSTGMIYLSKGAVPDKSDANSMWWEERLVRQLRVADARLARSEWLAGPLTVADFALYPIVAVRRALVEKAGDLPNLLRWADALAARPGVARAMAWAE